MKLLSNIVIACSLIFAISSCSAKENSSKNKKSSIKITAKQAAKLDTAYFAEGCFWCTEEIFQRTKGVKDAISGYSGGTKPNPTYEEVGSGTTNYAESVMVLYNSDEVTYRQLVRVFFGSQDPTQASGQGPDLGSQYRSIIFYQTSGQKKIANEVKKKISNSGMYNKSLAIEITSFKKFYKAEDYHQEYFTKHPNNSYIVHESKPRVQRFMKALPDLLKDKYKKDMQ